MNTKTKGWITVMGLFTVLLSVTMVFAQNGQVIKASSTYKTKEIKIGNFDQIKLQGSPTIVYTQSSEGKSELKVVGSDNLLDVLECEVTNGVLIVKFKNNTNIQFGKEGRLKVMASSPSLKSVQVQGSGDVVVGNDLKCTDLALNLQGSGDIKVGTVVCTNSFSANLQGSGDIVVENRLQSASTVLKVQGSGDIDVNSLTTKSAVASLQGSGDLRVKGAAVGGKVDIHLQGSGDLNFQGIQASHVTATLSGSGDMNLEGTTRQAKFVLNSSGSMDAENLRAQDVDARLSGSGRITCFVSGKLDSNASGSGRISYKGTPSQIESTGKNKPRKL